MSHYRAGGLEESAMKAVGDAMRRRGWDVQLLPCGANGIADLVVQKGPQRYLAEVKALAEGRPDRVLPLLSQAILQATTFASADSNTKPLAIVYVEHASSKLLERFQSFADQYAPGVAVGLVSGDGRAFFKIEGWIESGEQPRTRKRTPSASQPANIFSDLNQWMLKVLLAPELPVELLSAPRGRYMGGADLAEAAGVSAMSASRLLLQLRHEGFLSESAEQLTVVRRKELFLRWRAAAMRRPAELPVRFRIKAQASEQINGLLEAHPGQSCLGLFAAAERLGLGHVSGVPPYVYVPRLAPARTGEIGWGMLTHDFEGAPDLILRRSLSPQSTMRGAIVHGNAGACSDVIQVWLDVSNHPSRGLEQADLIARKVLEPMLGVR